jgi:hypothetical protein
MIALKWDEPAGCTSARGWVELGSAPIKVRVPEDCLTCGFYLDYGPAANSNRGPDGAPILASAYIRYSHPWTRSRVPVELGHNWFWTVADAKAWIERAVRDGFARLVSSGLAA